MLKSKDSYRVEKNNDTDFIATRDIFHIIAHLHKTYNLWSLEIWMLDSCDFSYPTTTVLRRNFFLRDELDNALNDFFGDK